MSSPVEGPRVGVSLEKAGSSVVALTRQDANARTVLDVGGC